jgi:hypothetical protein
MRPEKFEGYAAIAASFLGSKVRKLSPEEQRDIDDPDWWKEPRKYTDEELEEE